MVGDFIRVDLRVIMVMAVSNWRMWQSGASGLKGFNFFTTGLSNSFHWFWLSWMVQNIPGQGPWRKPEFPRQRTIILGWAHCILNVWLMGMVQNTLITYHCCIWISFGGITIHSYCRVPTEYPQVNVYSLLFKMAIEFVDLPINNGDVP